MPKQQQKIILLISLVLIAMNLYRAYSKHWDHADPIDYRGLYLGAKLWKQQQHIYNDSSAAELWQQIKVYEEFESTTDFGDQWVSIMVYPPQAFTLSYPLSFFNWRTSRMLWWMVCTSAFILFAFTLYQKDRSPSTVALLTGSSATFFAFSLGQPLLLVAACIILSIYFEKKSWLLSGLFIGIAMIKFSVVIPFALWYLARGNIKHLIAASVTTAVMIAPMFIQHPDILSEYSSKLGSYYEMIYTIHPRNIYTFSDSEITMLLNYYFPADISTWKITNAIAQLSLYSAMIFAHRLKKLDQDHLLLGLMLVSFVFSYHLSYDILLFFIPLVLISENNTKWWLSILLIALALPLNAVAGNFTLLKFNYTILSSLALLVFIFALIKGNFAKVKSHIAH